MYSDIYIIIVGYFEITYVRDQGERWEEVKDRDLTVSVVSEQVNAS